MLGTQFAYCHPPFLAFDQELYSFKVFQNKLGTIHENRTHASLLAVGTSKYFQDNLLLKKSGLPDDKKFNLDGPDGLTWYWHDFQKELECFPTPQNGGGCVIIWAFLSFYGLSKVISTTGTQNLFAYVNTLGS